MKTFTLRLTDDEAEALERMTFIENEIYAGERSKNKFIEELIANEYANYDKNAVINNKIKFITPSYAFAIALSDAAGSWAEDIEILKALAAIDYAYNKLASEFNDYDDEERDEYREIIDKLDEERDYLLERLRKVKTE